MQPKNLFLTGEILTINRDQGRWWSLCISYWSYVVNNSINATVYFKVIKPILTCFMWGHIAIILKIFRSSIKQLAQETKILNCLLTSQKRKIFLLFLSFSGALGLHFLHNQGTILSQGS